MNGRLPPRRSVAHARRLRARRSGPRLRSVQLLAGCLMAVCLAGMFAVAIAPSFAARTLEIHGATFTGQSIIRSVLGVEGTPNIFRIDTDRAAATLVRLPAVESASVEVRLPSTVVVDIVEREPRIVWVIGGNRYVADEDGLLFGLVDSAGNPIPSNAGPIAAATASAVPSSAASGSASGAPTPTPTPTPKPTPKKPETTATPARPGTKGSPIPSPTAGVSPAPTLNASLIPSLAPAPTPDPAAIARPGAVSLPVVFDRSSADAGLGLGGVVDPVDLDAGYRLAGLTPADVGSSSRALAVVLDDVHGFTLSSVPPGWVAEFGFYTPAVPTPPIRPDTIIPDQVRTLRSLFAYYGEAHVAWVRLVGDVSQNHVNTYYPR